MAGFEGDDFGGKFNPANFIADFLIDHPATEPEEMSEVRLYNVIARE